MAIDDTSNNHEIDHSKPDEVASSQSDTKKRKTHRLKQRFQVVKKLGQGTYGKVQLAINNETGQEVAIKTIKKSKVENDQDLVRIRREIQIMSSIQHPHITHIFEVFENKDKIVLVMQYASGGELYDYVSFKKVLSDVEARRLFRQIATAIYYCHKNKICHRDLKLENILLDEKGNAKIADFGLSNVFDEKHFLQTFCGSPLYASPEIVRGMSYFGPEVDCWSLGVLLYTLVYGAMPFDGSNFKKLVKQISESSYFEPANKSAASSLIKKLLTPNSSERATIIDICTDEWVNQDYEHSLLQVAEDLSNLTPVRLDLLFALAPVSPTETKKQDNFNSDLKENEIKPPNDRPINSTEPSSNKRTIENASSNTSTNDLIEKKIIKKKPKKVSKASKNAEVVSSEVDPNQSVSEPLTNNNVDIASKLAEKQDAQTLENVDPIKTIVNQTSAVDTVQNSNDDNLTSNLDKAIKSESNDSTENLASPKSTSSSNSLSGKRPGRLSIPKIWDNNQEIAPIESPKTDKKAPFIPVGLKVSDAKKVLERKCSVDLDLRGRRNSTELNEVKTPRDIKKYTSRSLSLNEIDTKKINAGKSAEKTIAIKKDKNVLKNVIEIGDTIEENEKTKSSAQSKPSTPVTEEDKSIAKQIIRKNIAKARLMEKRQISTTSTDSETTPLVSIENSNISIIKNAPKTCLDNKSSYDNSFSNLSNYSKEFNDTIVTQPSNAAPITRSYKKVTFTKDGACITESGKVFTREGKDGVLTRVEKKSKVTHIISGDPSTVSIQRSDSQSSSGSIDIFDDIFDDHWTGDGFISNMKSLFNNIFDGPRQLTEKKSLRSRAESLERSSNDLFAHRQNRKSSFLVDNDFGVDSIFDKQKSLFSSKSIFSNSIKSSFDKCFDMNNSLSSLSSSQFRKETPRLNHSLPKPIRFSRESSLHRDSDSFDSNRIFNDTENDRQESTRNRVEQWLKSDDGKDFDQKMGNYGTIGPKNFRRYMKTMTSNDSTNNCFKKLEMSTAKSSSFSSNAMEEEVKTSSMSVQSVAQKETVPRNTEIEVKFSLDDLIPKTVIGKANVSLNDNLNNAENSSCSVTSSSSGIKIAEQSSLLEQLRTFGYKNLVSRRLSESSSTEDICQNLSESQINSSHKTTEGIADTEEDSACGTNDELNDVIHRIKQHQQELEDDKSIWVNRRKKYDSESSSRLSINGQDSTTAAQETDFKSESVQERIRRKSYYSRFNEDSRSFSCRQRRRSVTRMNEFNSEFYSTSSSSSSLNRAKATTNPLGLQSFLSFDSDRQPTSVSNLLSKSTKDALSQFENSKSYFKSFTGSFDDFDDNKNIEP